MNPSPRVSFYTLGCRLNQAETAQIAQRFRRKGYRLVPHGDPVEVAVIHTCSVTERADQRCRQEIRRVKKSSPDAVLCAVGCYAQSDPDTVRGLLGVDLVVGNDRKYSLPTLIDGYEPGEGPEVHVSSKLDFSGLEVPEEGDFQETTRAHLKVQDGCDFHCGFCLLPRVRGAPRSRPFEEVIDAARRLVVRGFREIVVTGVNIGLYRDGVKNLGDVAQALSQLEGLDRIRISSIEPSTVPETLLEWLGSDPKACPHLHLPVQTGCETTLARMRRIYSIEDYARYVFRVKKLLPRITLGTDVIVGFPGETQEEFQASRNWISEMPFDYLHVFSYSDRIKTSATSQSEKVEPRIIKERSEDLRELGERQRRALYERWRGQRAELLTETLDRDGRRTGLTRHYLRVCLEETVPENAIVDVEIGAWRPENSCLGRLVGPIRLGPESDAEGRSPAFAAKEELE